MVLDAQVLYVPPSHMVSYSLGGPIQLPSLRGEITSILNCKSKLILSTLDYSDKTRK